jgi:protein phosphatase
MAGPGMRLETWFDSNIGRVRKANQDTVGCFPAEALFIVADGMGGHAEGEVASRLATEMIHAQLAGASTVPAADAKPAGLGRFLPSTLRRRSTGGVGAVDRLRLAIEAANRRVFDEGQVREHGQQGSMGTTVVVLRCDLLQERVSWAYVGDSRLYRVRAGRLMLLTADHTLYGEAYRDEDEIPSDLPHINRLQRAVGAQRDVEVSTGADTLRDGDLFLLCSDGVSGMIEPTQLEAEMTSGRGVAEIGKALIAMALEAGGKDNASALLVRVSAADVA